MLKLVFYTENRILKVRAPLTEDSFEHAYTWNNLLTFIITPKSDFTMTWTSYLPDLEPIYATALVELVGARYQVSDLHSKLYTLCPALSFKSDALEWVFYAGSFNPWHKGHQACLDLLPEDKLCLILPDQNPYKEFREINPVATVLEISSHARLKGNHFLVPSFLRTNEKNPTINWVKRFKQEFSHIQTSLLMGFDSFSQLKTWTRSQELLSYLHTVYVVSRLEDDRDRSLALDEAHALNANLNVIFLGRHLYEKLSSTQLR